ncbi:hypothetical protein [Pseudomonas sp. DP-17]|uniref:hypothetical protein n=1 Tax=Pseudomonas sp. DP-17 TaxID=1580486 RepID=UPI001EFA6E03|nr:hypothetical protein [Pseudomonas sp. DP-17]MCG8906948.1 hypothetical protein [Pseudomonas sp. DP-17]
MPAGLKAFLAQLERADNGPGEANQLFIFDQNQNPELMGSLRASSLGLPYTALPLFAGTGNLHMASHGPLWCQFPPHSTLSRGALYRASKNASGIALEADNPNAAQLHARDLLYLHEGCGLSLSAYYRPAKWAALALTAQPGLFGPWRCVYSPAPKHIGNPRGAWLRWDAPAAGDPLKPPYRQPPETAATYRTLRWLYWLDQHFETFGQPSPAQLPTLIDNLELLAEHDIAEGFLLLRLAPLCQGRPLVQRADVMAILQLPALPPYSKYQRLLQL